MKSPFKIESFGKSDVGLIREQNEDVFKELPHERFFILADGMGGHNAGEVAASKAVEYMCSAVQKFFVNKPQSVELEDVQYQITSLIENTNLWVHHLSISTPHYYGMGTTLCSILFFKEFIIYSHVGDSRIYRFRNHCLSLLTKDHTVFYKNNPTKESSTGVSFQRKILAKAIGTSVFVSPEVFADKAEVGDIYLLCSDGLTDLVSDNQIEALLKNCSDLSQVTTLLIETAKERGGHDNITLLLVHLYDTSPTKSPA